MATRSSALPRRAWSRTLKSVYDFLDDVAGGGDIPALTGLSVQNAGAGPMRKTVLTFTNVAIAMADNAGVVAYGSAKIFDFPAGSIKIHGATANLTVKKSSAGITDAFDGDFALGSVAANNGATLATTEQDVIPTTPTPQATGAGAAAVTTAKGRNAADIVPFDGTTTALDLYFNMLIDDSDHDVTTTPANIILNGTVTVLWSNLGDY